MMMMMIHMTGYEIFVPADNNRPYRPHWWWWC